MNELPTIDPEFRGLVPPLSVDEYKQLEENIETYRIGIELALLKRKFFAKRLG